MNLACGFHIGLKLLLQLVKFSVNCIDYIVRIFFRNTLSQVKDLGVSNVTLHKNLQVTMTKQSKKGKQL